MNNIEELICQSRIKEISCGSAPLIGEKERLALTAMHWYQEHQSAVEAFQETGRNLLLAQEKITALIAQLEAAQKERDVYANLASDVGDIITLLQNNEWAEHVGKTNVGGLLEHQITRLMNSIADINTKLSAAEARLLVPEGYCIMPESLTAENGAKGALSGEFFTEKDITCEECGGDRDEDDPCEYCNDLGVQTVRSVIGWSTIKDIYKMAVDTTAIRAAGFKVEGV
ncbi:TPA: hypothetical protein PXO57_004061 [Yersinia enterocolitica]|nr:hypothetical protein [Yersinia enterocolitica]HDL7593580.1 hypothetical protein [Yersinia enterocolitica]